MKRFFFHYNKPASKQAKEVIWSVHFQNVCHLVKRVECKVPIETKVNKRQPYAVVRGWAKDVIINETSGAIIK